MGLSIGFNTQDLPVIDSMMKTQEKLYEKLEVNYEDTKLWNMRAS